MRLTLERAYFGSFIKCFRGSMLLHHLPLLSTCFLFLRLETKCFKRKKSLILTLFRVAKWYREIKWSRFQKNAPRYAGRSYQEQRPPAYVLNLRVTFCNVKLYILHCVRGICCSLLLYKYHALFRLVLFPLQIFSSCSSNKLSFHRPWQTSS
jgi:hypothetical protein